MQRRKEAATKAATRNQGDVSRAHQELVFGVENHINMNDLLLVAVMDLSELGETESEDSKSVERFAAITELLKIHREKNRTFVQSMYRKK